MSNSGLKSSRAAPTTHGLRGKGGGPASKSGGQPEPGSRANRYRYYVSPAANGAGGDGSLERPSATIADALVNIGRRHGATAPSVKKLAGYDSVEICAVARPNAQPSPRDEPRYEFFVDPLGVADGRGTGTALAPWPDLESALAAVARLEAAGSLSLRRGEHLRLTVREVFSATPVDQRKRRSEWIAMNRLRAGMEMRRKKRLSVMLGSRYPGAIGSHGFSRFISVRWRNLLRIIIIDDRRLAKSC